MKPIFAVPTTLALIYRAWSHKSLTPAGIVAAVLTAVVHALHPWNLPFVLLIVFFLAGTRVTKIKKEVKEKLTIQSTGSSGGEGPRTHIQVLANSGVASILVLLSTYQLSQRSKSSETFDCYPWGGDLLIVGIIANYAAVAADTFSSELGILSESQPRLITSLALRKVPRGTNGGVTVWGLLAGVLGSLIVVASAMVFLPFCGAPVLRLLGCEKWAIVSDSTEGNGWDIEQIIFFSCGMVIWGATGSVLDSILGGWLQQSVVDTRSGRVVEGEGGKRVLVSQDIPSTIYFKKRAELKAEEYGSGEEDAISNPAASADWPTERQTEKDTLYEKMPSNNRHEPDKKMTQTSLGDGEPSRVVESGLGLLDNNEVNFLMALTMSLGAMAIAGWAWDVPFQSILPVQII